MVSGYLEDNFRILILNRCEMISVYENPDKLENDLMELDSQPIHIIESSNDIIISTDNN